MTFITVAFLSGIALIAVPVVLHLIMRRQPRLLEFPALRFLQVKAQSNRRQLRLRHLLLLLLRCAVIALLALALARPSLRGDSDSGQSGPVATALVFDTSPRMEYMQQNITRLQAAQEMALWLSPQLPPESELAVVSSLNPTAAFAVSRSAARQQIERLRTSPIVQPLPELIDQTLQLIVESNLPRKEIYVFTDLSQGAWTADTTEYLAARLDEHQNVVICLIDVGVESARNVGLGDLELSGQIINTGQVLRLTAPLLATMPEGERDVELWLDNDGSAAEKRGQQTISWSNDQSPRFEFQLNALDVGTHQGEMRMVGEDSLPFDDRRFFTVEVRDAPQVLLAMGPDAEPLYLQMALEVAGFDCETTITDRLAEQSLNDFAAVFLADPPQLTETTWQDLDEYVRQGGGLAILLGRNAQRTAMDADAAQRLLPGKLLRRGHDAGRLAPSTLQHPLLAAFRPFAGEIPWGAFPVETYWQFDALDGDVRTVITFANDKSAVVEQALGQGPRCHDDYTVIRPS